jgi:hypothetical protein
MPLRLVAGVCASSTRFLEGGSCPTISTTTSSLLAPAQAEAHSPIDSRRPGSASCSSSAVTISPASGPIWDSTEVFVNGKYRAPEFWLDNHGEEFPPEVNYYVGGNTKFYGAALFRLRPQDFGEIQHFGGKSPAWPIDYQDLEPYYTQAEHLYLVRGQHGEDPTEGPVSAAYRHPPVRHEARIQQLSDDLESRACTRSTYQSG